jgi:EAL domain-containing protein (putative c-di-GMP-specific phosphodiesterase class I)
LPDLKSAEIAGAIAQQLIHALREPMQFGLNSVVITPSIGVADYPQDASDAESLLRNADLAMYVAKGKGPGMLAFYDMSMNATAVRRFRIEDRLRGALERDEFSLAYQPQFDVRTGAVSGMEALLRWTSSDLGPVPPGELIPVAEESGLILGIGAWVLREACRQARMWHQEGFVFGRMAVNVSGRQFALPEFSTQVAAILRETGLHPAMLELEITESVIMADEKWTEQALLELKRLSVTLAIDDFGTGHSSFGRLRHFAVDRLKIDRSFVTRINDGTDDRAIAAAIIAMSRSLRMQVTAEGVESLPQLLFLQEHDCHEAQGYLLSKPLSPQHARELLRRAGELSDSSSSQRLKTLIG